MVDVRRQVEAAALLACLDNDDASRMRNPLLFQRGDRAQAREHRVAVVGGTAPVEAVAFELRRPCIEVGAPAGHFGLFVHMAIEQDTIVSLAGNLHEEQRRALRKPDHLERRAFRQMRSRPFFEARNNLVHMAVRLPFGIERDRLVRDANVFREFGNYRGIPNALDVTLRLALIHEESLREGAPRGKTISALQAARRMRIAGTKRAAIARSREYALASPVQPHGSPPVRRRAGQGPSAIRSLPASRRTPLDRRWCRALLIQH